MKWARLTMLSLAAFSGVSVFSHAAPPVEKIKDEGWAACKTEDDLDKFIKFATQEDEQAITSMFLSGKCVPLKKGQEFFVMDIHMFSGKAEIRKKGATQNLWTVYEAIQGK